MRHIWENTLRVGRVVWGEKKLLTICLVFVFTTVSLGPFLVNFTTGNLINHLIANRQVDTTLVGLVGMFICAHAVPVMFWVWQLYLVKMLWLFLGTHFELALIRKKGEIDVATLEDPARQDLINKVNENGCNRIQTFTERQFWFLQNAVEVALAASVLIFFKWWVFLIVLAGTIPQLYVEVKYGKSVWDIHGWHAEKRRRFWNMSWHMNYAPWLTELKIFQSVGHFFKLMSGLLLEFRSEQKKVETRKVLYSLGAMVVAKLVFAFATAWFVWEVVHGDIMVGSLVFILASIQNMRGSLSGCFFNMGRQYEDSLFVKDVFTFLDMPPAIQRPKWGHRLDPGFTPEIVFENVSFAYPNTTKLVLQDFNLRIPPGRKVAIVGINGAGKTTLIKLLCRFYDPTRGRILVDGRDLREVDLESWYSHLGVLFQEYADYKFPVKEGIAFGDTARELDGVDVTRSAVAAEAHPFICEWKAKYDQQLGKGFSGGVEPSRGQWQKLAIARAWYRQPNVLVLDEPTSSVDAEAEAKIFSKLEKFPSHKTVVFISHRFSTVRQADLICVIEGGKVTGFAPHQVLMATNPTYSELFKLQARGYR